MVKKHWQHLSGRGKRALSKLQNRGGWRALRRGGESESQESKSHSRKIPKTKKTSIKQQKTVGPLHRRHK